MIKPFITFLICCISLSFFACQKTAQVKDEFYGKWIDKKYGVALDIDSTNHLLSIDYSRGGGKIRKGHYSLDNRNQLKTDILADGAVISLNDGKLKFTSPIQKMTESIEVIYITTFSRVP